MKKNLIRRVAPAALLLALALFLAACGGGSSNSESGSGSESDTAVAEDATVEEAAPAIDPITITYASNDAPGALRYDLLEQKFADLMAEKTNGLITVEIYPSGSLSKPGQLLDGIKNGTVDTGMDSYTRYAGQYPYFDLLTAPGWKFNTFEEFTDVANDFVREFPDAGTDIYKVVVMCDAGQFGLVSTKPIRTTADIKGNAVRNTAQFIPLFDKLGASSVDVSSGEMYEALRLNTIDAVNTNNHAIPTFHLDEVCASFTALPIEHTDFAIFMSQKLYDSLDPTLQAQVDEVCAEMRQVALDYVYAATKDAIDMTMASNPDFEFLELSDADIDALAETARSILEAKAAELDGKGLRGTEAYDWINARQSQ
jgi:TRAP-type C4-dicarboxylate transport system substrate-binding protein